MGRYFKNGKLWSAEAFRLVKTQTLSGSSETNLWTQTAVFDGSTSAFIYSTSNNDVAPGLRTLELGVDPMSGPAAPGDVLALVVAGITYSYTITGHETSQAQVFNYLANKAASDTHFAVESTGTTLELTSKQRGAIANAVSVSWTWLVGAGLLTTTNNAATLGGTGAWYAQVEYIDVDGYKRVENLNLSGTTSAVTSKGCKWLQRLAITGCGSGGALVGTLHGQISSTDQLTIAAGQSESFSAAYLVPAKKQLRFCELTATASAATTIKLKSNYDPTSKGLVANPTFNIADAIVTTMPEDIELPYLVGPYAPGSLIAVTATGGNNHQVAVNLDYYLEPEGYLA